MQERFIIKVFTNNYIIIIFVFEKQVDSSTLEKNTLRRYSPRHGCIFWLLNINLHIIKIYTIINIIQCSLFFWRMLPVCDHNFSYNFLSYLFLIFGWMPSISTTIRSWPLRSWTIEQSMAPTHRVDNMRRYYTKEEDVHLIDTYTYWPLSRYTLFTDSTQTNGQHDNTMEYVNNDIREETSAYFTRMLRSL